MPKKKETSTRIDWKKHLTTITPLSRGVAFILFIIIPFFTFLSGVWYGEVYTRADFYSKGWSNGPEQLLPYQPSSERLPIEEETVCTLDAMVCPDGSYVGRQGPTCEFAPCPTQ